MVWLRADPPCGLFAYRLSTSSRASNIQSLLSLLPSRVPGAMLLLLLSVSVFPLRHLETEYIADCKELSGAGQTGHCDETSLLLWLMPFSVIGTGLCLGFKVRSSDGSIRLEHMPRLTCKVVPFFSFLYRFIYFIFHLTYSINSLYKLC